MGRADQQAFEYLLEHHLDQVNDYCRRTGARLEDFLPKSVSDFHIKGVPKAAASAHYEHFEQLRSCKIAKLVADLSTLLKSRKVLITAVTIPEPRVKPRSPTPLRQEYAKPQDWMDAAARHLLMKREKSVEVLQRLCKVKQSRQEWVASKLQEFENRQKKQKAQRKETQAKHLAKVKKSQEHRNQVHLRKQVLDQEYEAVLHSTELKQKARLETRQTSNTPAKSARPHSTTPDREKLTKLAHLHRIETQATLNEERRAYHIEQRVLVSKSHSQLVQTRLANVRAQDQAAGQKSLQRVIAKSAVIEQKTEACHQSRRHVAEHTKEMRDRLFTRQSKQLSYIRSLQQETTKRLEQSRLSKDRSAQELRAQQDSTNHARSAKNSARQAQQAQLYSSVVTEHQQFKAQVVTKHARLAHVAEQLSEFKEQLASHQRETNFELQQLRSLLR